VSETTHDAGGHYDRVTAAWTWLLGEELHYGVFERGDEDLATATRRLTSLMAEAGQIGPGQQVLDVGCGTGAPACHLASTYGARVTGISTSGVGVRAATDRAAAAALAGRVTFLVGDGMSNGFADGSFDRVWAQESSHLMRDRGRLVAECARVLRPGGRLVLCDIVLRREMPFEEVRRLLRPLSLLREVFGDARMEPVELYARLVEDEGLTVDAQLDLTSATRPTLARWRANAERYRDEVVSVLGAPEWRRFVAACDVLERFWDDNTLGYALLAAQKP